MKGVSLMLNFIKNNVKFVVAIGVSFVIIAGLTTALIVTNVGGGRGQSRDRNRDQIRVELTEEQIAERAENARERMEQRLQQRLEDGRITEEEYNESRAAIESGEYPAFERSRERGNKHGGGRNRHSAKEFSFDKNNTTPETDETTSD